MHLLSARTNRISRTKRSLGYLEKKITRAPWWKCKWICAAAESSIWKRVHLLGQWFSSSIYVHIDSLTRLNGGHFTSAFESKVIKAICATSAILHSVHVALDQRSRRYPQALVHPSIILVRRSEAEILIDQLLFYRELYNLVMD